MQGAGGLRSRIVGNGLFVTSACLGKGDLPVFIAVDDTGKVAGQSCAMIEQVKIGTGCYRLGWAVDTIILT